MEKQLVATDETTRAYPILLIILPATNKFREQQGDSQLFQEKTIMYHIFYIKVSTIYVFKHFCYNTLHSECNQLINLFDFEAIQEIVPLNLGKPNCTCQSCGAIMWYEEWTVKCRKVRMPKFSFSCYEGKVQLPLLKEAPEPLKILINTNSGKQSNWIQEWYQKVHSMYTFTSMGG